MVPLPRYSTVAGVQLADLLSDEEIEEVVDRTRHGGAEIVKYLQTGSAYYAPGKSTAIMVDAILKDTKQIHPCAVMLEGEYGYKDVVSGVPVMLGANGAEKIIEVTLDESEEAQFAKSVASVQDLVDTLNKNNFFEGDK
jgi:malate dehydrogenase